MAGRSYKRTSRGTRINKYGVRITASQYRQFRYEVQQANKIRGQELAKASAERRADWGTLKSKQGDFTLSYKKVDFDRFASQKQFDYYFKRVHFIVSGTYQRHINRVYKENLIKSINKKFSSSADFLVEKVKKLRPSELRDLTLADKLHDVGWVYYDPTPDNVKFVEINEQLDKLIARRKR